MKRVAAFLLKILLFAASGVKAAPVDTLTPAQMSSTAMTVEQLLGVPPAYMVMYCRILLSHRDKGAVMFFYCPDGCAGCATISAKGFPGMWSGQLHQWILAGYTFILADIEMRRGTKVMRWQQKSFAAPR